MKTSAISGFSKLSLDEKIKILKEFAGLDDEDIKLIKKYQELPDFLELENNIGPFKIATNFLVNGKDYFVPMEIEEPSVVAAACRGAKLIREGGGFKGEYLDSKMIGQLQLIEIENIEEAKKNLLENKNKILEIANEADPILVKLGGGAKDLEVREVETKNGKNVVLHLIVDTLDAMGANAVNTMLEKIASFVSDLSKGKVCLRIISNFALKRVVRVEGKIPIDKLKREGYSGEEVAKAILNAYYLAEADIFRAVTHNKGIMNGIDAVAIATGNDFRAIEAGVHSYACKDGNYKPVSNWSIENNFLIGKIEIPLAIATFGGATGSKKAKLALKILRVKSAKELGVVAASVGLANNLAALSVLGTEGIQKGHMKLHKEFLKLTRK
jgi:hydroxymethylglutaryl-CoA reductase